METAQYPSRTESKKIEKKKEEKNPAINFILSYACRKFTQKSESRYILNNLVLEMQNILRRLITKKIKKKTTIF